jgi:predicted CoA-binding protein
VSSCVLLEHSRDGIIFAVKQDERDLRPLFDPRSVAVIGASNDPAKWGQWVARGALRGEHRRAVYLVNRSGGEVMGRPAYRSVDELPEAPELVVLAVPATAFEETVDASLAAGARAIVAIAAGFGETSDEGRERERAVTERVRAAGAVLLGPNCMGVYDSSAELDLGSEDFTPGPIGLISQSGNFALEISLLASDSGSASRASRRSATRPTSRLPSSCAPSLLTRKPGSSASTARTSGTGGRSHAPRTRQQSRGSRCCCWQAAPARPVSARRARTRARSSATRVRSTPRAGLPGSSA